ncbi:MAG: DUF1634 domain-containing protein [Bacteroidia bacterium]
MIKKRGNTDNLDKGIEKIIGNLLLTGVIIAASVVIFGAILFLVKHGLEIPSYDTFNAYHFNHTNFHNLLTGLTTFQSDSIMEFGILLLIATPVLRVLFSVFAFAYEKDYMYVIFTAFVFCVLIFSFLS